VRVGRSGESGLLCWCGFNASFSARNGRRRDEELSKYEVKVASSSWFNEQEE
jgi:hypothetical protein